MRVTSYLDELATVFSSSIIMLILDVVKVIAILIWMCVVGSWLTLIMIAAVIPMVFLLGWIARVLERRRRVYREKRSNRIAYIAENIQGSSVTTSFNRRQRNTVKSRKCVGNEKSAKSGSKSFMSTNCTIPQ